MPITCDVIGQFVHLPGDWTFHTGVMCFYDSVYISVDGFIRKMCLRVCVCVCVCELCVCAPSMALTLLKSRWETPQKVVENKRAKLLRDFQIQTDRKMLANQPDIVVIDKQQEEAVVTDVAVPSDSNTKKKEYEKLEKYQGLREEL